MKRTIADMRRKSLSDLQARATSQRAVEEAAKTMNKYYRLVGLDERLLYLENNERTCNSKYTQELEEVREKRFKALKRTFEEDYNATLIYFGYYPTICDKDTTEDLYLAHFYK